MLLPGEVQKCAVFLMYLDKSTMQFTFAGIGFLIDLLVENVDFGYAVTARQIIVGIRQRSANDKVYVRMNLKQAGSLLVETSAADWLTHPSDTSVDVSILPFGPDTAVFDYLSIPTSMFVTSYPIQREAIGIGDEVLITGLFDSHGFRPRNIPIVKGGRLAAMPEEPIDTEHFGSMDTYLVETASGGGLIGAPAFVQLGSLRPAKQYGTIIQQADPFKRTYYFLGLMHGPWHIGNKDADGVRENGSEGQINQGIAIIVPARRIMEIINQRDWVRNRLAIVDGNIRKRLRWRIIPSLCKIRSKRLKTTPIDESQPCAQKSQMNEPRRKRTGYRPLKSWSIYKHYARRRAAGY